MQDLQRFTALQQVLLGYNNQTCQYKATTAQHFILNTAY